MATVTKCTLMVLALSASLVHTQTNIIAPSFEPLLCTTLLQVAIPESIDLLNGTVQVFTSTQSTLQISIKGLNDASSIVAELNEDGYFAPGRQVVFITHGFLQNVLDVPWMIPLKNKILQVDPDSTIIIVYWIVKADDPDYRQSAFNTKSVAQFISGMASAIQNISIFAENPSQLYLYCIGHSLGAHTCGQAGRFNGNFNRVTGLDPAGPGFINCPSYYDLRINVSSAACVDIIHTEGGGFNYLIDPIPYWGALPQWADLDFYPNSGLAIQPGCNILSSIKFPHCSHGRAVDVFITSVINPNSFISNGTCNNITNLPASCTNITKQIMGYYSSCYKNSSGIVEGVYYLPTDPTIPLYWADEGLTTYPITN